MLMYWHGLRNKEHNMNTPNPTKPPNTDTNTTTEKQEYADTLLFNKKGQILLVKRSAKDDFMPNKWWIVGGKIEANETPEQGAIRELAEEIGVKLSDLTFVEKVNLPTGGISHRFAGVVDNDTPIHLKKDELQAYKWLDVSELSKFDLLGKLSDLQDLVELTNDIIELLGGRVETQQHDDNATQDDEQSLDLVSILKNLIQFTEAVSLQSLPDSIDYSKLRKSIMEIFKVQMRDTKAFCQPLNAQVEVRMSGAKHVLNSGATRDKMVLLLKSVAFIAGARSARELVVDSDKPNITNAYLITTPIELNGKSEQISQIILTDNQGNLFYDLHLQKEGVVSNKYKFKENGLSVNLDDEIHQAHSQATIELDVPASEKIGLTQSFLAQSNSDDDSIATDSMFVNGLTTDSDFGFDKVVIGTSTNNFVINLFFKDEISLLFSNNWDSNNKTQPPSNSLLQLSNNPKPFNRTNIIIPRTKTTCQKANNQAFAILDKLDNGEITPADLTDDDKQILENIAVMAEH